MKNRINTDVYTMSTHLLSHSDKYLKNIGYLSKIIPSSYRAKYTVPVKNLNTYATISVFEYFFFPALNKRDG